MASLLSPLRAMRRHKSSPSSRTSLATTESPPDPSTQPEAGPSSALMGDRRILPDIKALLESVEFNQPGPSSGDYTTPLTPSRRHMRHNQPNAGNPGNESDDDMPAISRRDKGKARTSAVIADTEVASAISDDEQADNDASVSPLPFTWSTFGKRVKRSMPDLRDFGRHSGSGRSDGVTTDVESTSRRSRRGSKESPRSGSVASASSLRSGHTFARGGHSRGSTGMWTTLQVTASSASPSRRSSAKRSTVSGAVGRPSTSMTHYSTASNRIGRMPNVEASPDPSSSSSRSVQFTTPGTNHRSEYNSPPMFGHIFGHHTRSGSATTPPPLSPALLESFPDSDYFGGSSTRPSSPREDDVLPLSFPTTTSVPAVNEETVGPRRQSRLGQSTSGTFLSFTFGRTFRSQSHAQPRTSGLHPSGSTELGERGWRKRARTQSRPRKKKTSKSKPDAQRRDSAEWNARQATEGVVARPSVSNDYGWPAEVSREMLRLSLANPNPPSYLHPRPISASDPGRVPQDLFVSAKSIPDPRNSYATSTTRHAQNGQANQCETGSGKGRSAFSFPPLPSSPPPPPLFLSSSPSSTSPPNGGLKPGVDRDATETKPFPTTTRNSEFSNEGIEEQSAVEEGADRRRRSLPLSDLRRDNDDTPGSDLTSERLEPDEATGRMIQHVRSDSENQIRWESRQLQDFLATGIRLVEKRPVTPDAKPVQPLASTSAVGSGSGSGAASSSLLSPPAVSVTAPTPQVSPGRPGMSSKSSDDRRGEASSSLAVPPSDMTPQKTGGSSKSQGKRKAEESDEGSPPKENMKQGSGSRKTKTTSFAATEGLERGPHRVSNNSSQAPSSFSNKSRKRVRLSSTPMISPDHSRPTSATHSPTSGDANPNTSWSSKGSSRATSGIHSQAPSRATSHRTMSAGPSTAPSRHQKTRSISQASIPLSAIVSPRAPSIDRLSQYHMRDPRKPRRRPVGWGLRMRNAEDEGSPVHAWCFWLGLLLPPLWWFASFAPIPCTRVVGIGTDAAEKGIQVDDPHVERESRTWRTRCRIASVVFFVTYAPVIILLAIFTTR